MTRHAKAARSGAGDSGAPFAGLSPAEKLARVLQRSPELTTFFHGQLDSIWTMARRDAASAHTQEQADSPRKAVTR